MSIVADCSGFLPLCFTDEQSDASERMLDEVAEHGAVVPAIWWYEIRNALLVNERRRRIKASESAEFLDLLGKLPIEIDLDHDARLLASLSREHQLTIYDAAYLEVAHRRSLPLFTLDRRLEAAAKAADVALWKR